jgi:hypothetical protein
MTMKAFKVALHVGMQIRVSDHWIADQRNTLRTITKLQGNGFFFTPEGDNRRGWMGFPSAAQLNFAGTTAQIRIDETRRWTLHLTPHGEVDHYRWERVRGNENECDAERRLSKEAEVGGANMREWWQQWFERSDEWRAEIGHDIREVEECEAPTP